MKAKYLLAAGVALASGAALAQIDSRNDPQRSSEMPSATVKVDFNAMDRNMDQTLSTDEVSGNSSLSQAFSRLDTDRNGTLSNAEFAKFESDGSSAKGSAKTRGKSDKSDKSTGEKIEDKLD